MAKLLTGMMLNYVFVLIVKVSFHLYMSTYAYLLIMLPICIIVINSDDDASSKIVLKDLFVHWC